MAIMQDRVVEGEPGFGTCPWCRSPYELRTVTIHELSNVSQGRCRNCVPPRIVYSAAQLRRVEAALHGDAVDPLLVEHSF